jgi:hypothetical protein
MNHERSPIFWWLRFFVVPLHRQTKNALMKIELQLIAAFVLSIGGLILLFCGIFIDPQGQIHETLLVAFGETATFAGALFGIDYVYKKKR